MTVRVPLPRVPLLTTWVPWSVLVAWSQAKARSLSAWPQAFTARVAPPTFWVSPLTASWAPATVAEPA